jgi:hypothetical protein
MQVEAQSSKETTTESEQGDKDVETRIFGLGLTTALPCLQPPVTAPPTAPQDIQQTNQQQNTKEVRETQATVGAKQKDPTSLRTQRTQQCTS